MATTAAAPPVQRDLALPPPGSQYIVPFEDLTLDAVAQVGGKNPSLGEIVRALGARGIRGPDAFALTAGLGIDSISLHPDSLVTVAHRLAARPAHPDRGVTP